MKIFGKFSIPLLVVLISLPLFISCKKGPGDPWFSIYSRKERLTGHNWKVTSIQQTVTYKNATVTTSFNGSKMSVTLFVTDTTVYLPSDTLYYYKHFNSSTGSIYYSFNKDGTYQIDQAFTDDTTYVQFTSQEKGDWYFTGGGHDSDTKTKELLGMQPTSYVYNPLSINTYTYTYSGQNSMYIYHIYKLASKEIELHYDTQVSVNLYQVTTHGKMILDPR